jgi:hypothetical protein
VAPCALMRTCPLLLCLALALSGCTTWQGRPGALAVPVARRDQVRLWVHGEKYQVHGLRISRDSVIAVPFFRDPDCDSCALRFARSAVDSVQARAFDGRVTLFWAIVLTPVIYVFYLVSQIPPT